MKTKLLFLLLSIGLLLAAFSCKTTKVNPGTVQYTANPAPGAVTVTSHGYGNTDLQLEKSARTLAFETILFRGLPAAEFTALRLPMIENEREARSGNSAFFKKFFEEDGCNQFVTAVSKLGNKPGKTADRKKTMDYSLTINYEALRRHLEQNQVLRKFGY
jgi:hypothetical protein